MEDKVHELWGEMEEEEDKVYGLWGEVEEVMNGWKGLYWVEYWCNEDL